MGRPRSLAVVFLLFALLQAFGAHAQCSGPSLRIDDQNALSAKLLECASEWNFDAVEFVGGPSLTDVDVAQLVTTGTLTITGPFATFKLGQLTSVTDLHLLNVDSLDLPQLHTVHGHLVFDAVALGAGMLDAVQSVGGDFNCTACSGEATFDALTGVGGSMFITASQNLHLSGFNSLSSAALIAFMAGQVSISGFNGEDTLNTGVMMFMVDDLLVTGFNRPICVPFFGAQAQQANITGFNGAFECDGSVAFKGGVVHVSGFNGPISGHIDIAFSDAQELHVSGFNGVVQANSIVVENVEAGEVSGFNARVALRFFRANNIVASLTLSGFRGRLEVEEDITFRNVDGALVVSGFSDVEADQIVFGDVAGGFVSANVSGFVGNVKTTQITFKHIDHATISGFSGYIVLNGSALFEHLANVTFELGSFGHVAYASDHTTYTFEHVVSSAPLVGLFNARLDEVPLTESFGLGGVTIRACSFPALDDSFNALFFFNQSLIISEIAGLQAVRRSFQTLFNVGAAFELTGVSALESMQGSFGNLNQVATDMTIESTNLSTLQFPMPLHVLGTLMLRDNPRLEHVDHLSRLQSATAIHLENNPSLLSLTGLCARLTNKPDVSIRGSARLCCAAAHTVLSLDVFNTVDFSDCTESCDSSNDKVCSCSSFAEFPCPRAEHFCETTTSRAPLCHDCVNQYFNGTTCFNCPAGGYPDPSRTSCLSCSIPHGPFCSKCVTNSSCSECVKGTWKNHDGLCESCDLACLNGGACHMTGSDAGKACSCANGFAGDRCQTSVPLFAPRTAAADSKGSSRSHFPVGDRLQLTVAVPLRSGVDILNMRLFEVNITGVDATGFAFLPTTHLLFPVDGGANSNLTGLGDLLNLTSSYDPLALQLLISMELHEAIFTAVAPGARSITLDLFPLISYSSTALLDADADAVQLRMQAPLASASLLLLPLSHRFSLHATQAEADAAEAAQRDLEASTGDGGLSTGAIVGIAVGCAAAVLLLAFGCYRKRHANHNTKVANVEMDSVH